MPFELHPARSLRARDLIKSGIEPIFETRDGMYFHVPSPRLSQRARAGSAIHAEFYEEARIEVEKLEHRRRVSAKVTTFIFSASGVSLLAAVLVLLLDNRDKCPIVGPCPPPGWEFPHVMMATCLVLLVPGIIAARIEGTHTERAVKLMEHLNARLKNENHLPGTAERRRWLDNLMGYTDD